jgi:hypothetical protein
VTIAQEPLPEVGCLPDVSGRYLLFEDRVQFVPHFPFEKEVKYCASFVRLEERISHANGAKSCEKANKKRKEKENPTIRFDQNFLIFLD